ncbi:uncharacterized protein TNCV_2120921 [Trichonephila clavipes]|nr:uncharacterized protein TNCV_2120921 [Trichonephila clavipes]
MHRNPDSAAGIMDWGGDRFHWRTPLVFITATLKSQRYISEIGHAARWLYQERYPNRRVPHHTTFPSVNRGYEILFPYRVNWFFFMYEMPVSLCEDINARVYVTARRIRDMPKILQNLATRHLRPGILKRFRVVSVPPTILVSLSFWQANHPVYTYMYVFPIRMFKRKAINTVQFSDKSTEDFPVICYTGVSKTDGRVGFAFVVFRSGVESENFQFRIRDKCTVFVAELLCLNFAVKWNTEQNSVISEYLICTDSLSSLDSFKCIFSTNILIVEIQNPLKSLRDKNISIDFAFVRGHTGVLGNERADWLAKAATKHKIDIDVNIPKSFYKKITEERTVKSWNQEYLICNKGSITKKFFPTINKRLSCHHFYTNYKLTQFLTGHGNFKSYLNKFNLVPSSFCDCNIGGQKM